MRLSIAFAILAGIAWGLGGYFEKIGLRTTGMPASVGIALRTFVAVLVLGAISFPAWKTVARPVDVEGWLMIIIGGGVLAGAFGMWSFYAALSLSENLGATLAIAFAFSPIAGTLMGVLRRDQPFDLKIGFGLFAIIIGIVLIQLSHGPVAKQASG